MGKLIQTILEFLSRFPSPRNDVRSIAWGSHVSQTFRDRICWTADELGIDVSWLMAVIAFETGRTFKADTYNVAGSGAVGLIQFMPTTAAGLGTTSDALAGMSAEDQIRYVYRYLLPHRGRIMSLSDLYMAILWPAAVGKPPDYVLFDKRRQPKAYTQNSGLDENQDLQITKSEAVQRVYRELERGNQPGNVWSGEVRTTQ